MGFRRMTSNNMIRVTFGAGIAVIGFMRIAMWETLTANPEHPLAIILSSIPISILLIIAGTVIARSVKKVI